MKKQVGSWNKMKGLFFLSLCLVFFSCDSGGESQSGDASDSGAMLQGNIVSVSTASFQIATASNLTVSIGGLAVTPDEQGYFQIENIPTGDQVVRFESTPTGNLVVQAETGINAEYLVVDIEESETIIMDDIEIEGSKVSTAHTGTWIGTAGSSDEDSQGQIAFTMYIEANGNEISGTGILGGPDNSIWNIEDGTENGRQMSGIFKLDRSDSLCATDASFSGTFAGNTVSGTFDELNPPSECGLSESGTFSLVKEE